MRWMKHDSGFCRSEAMSEIRNALGNAGYGAVWLMLERIAEAWDGRDMPRLCLPEREWKNVCGFSEKKFQIFVKILEKHSFIQLETHNSLLCLTASILLRLQDEWTRKHRRNSGVTPASLRSHSGIQTDRETDIDKDRKTRASANLRLSLFPVLKRHAVETDSIRGRNIIRFVEQKQPRNPGGYLESILQKKPDFDPWPDGQNNKQTTCLEEPVSAGELLRDIGFAPPPRQGEKS
jgi:hypothetical protein